MNQTPSAKAIFNEALDVSPGERGAFLDRACAGDAALRARVDELLAVYEGAGRFLASPTGATAPTASTLPARAALTEGPGTRIGPYKLLQLIGEGGFGSVFMAEQEKPVARRVALKIIKLGMDTRQVIARFEAERQALAMMDHPNIARVLDAGATETGRPYFVMDLVKGDPIAEYCDKNSLSIEDRLELFAQVCAAVQHAHTKGIIHRDIKPSNILVSTQDGRPLAKVIDFGIAKATASKLTEKTLFTEHKALIGTPEYMSPEQAEGSLDIDTRTDVYSLGVLLYELLTGSTPFSGMELRSAAYAEIQRIIREVEPPKPSTRISQSTDTLASVAAHRHTEPRRLGATVRGELDWIVMKALEKDRQRRYETANGLGMDIRRYLSGEAVVAAPPSRIYRARKFVRRNKGPVAAGLLVTLALVLGMVGTSVGLVRAERARAAEAEQRVAADKSRVRAETISQFVTTALKASDAQNDGGGQAMTILGAMDNAIKDIDSGRFKDDPETEAGLKMTIARILLNNGRVAEAEPLSVQALEMRRRLHPGDHPDVAESLSWLASVRGELGRAAEAEPLDVQSLEMYQRLYKGDHPRVAAGLNNLAHVRHSLGRVAEAEPLYVQSLEMNQRLHPGDSMEVATSLNNLGGMRLELGRVAEAEPLLVQALETYQRLYRRDHPAVALGLNNLGGVRHKVGRVAEAEPLFAQALEMRQRLYKGDHPDVAHSLHNLAAVRRDLGHLAEAEPLFVQALEMYQRLFKGDHPKVANGLLGLADVLEDLGRVEEAELLFVQALAMRQRLHKGDHPDVAEVLSSLAHVRLESDRAGEAERLYMQALEMYQRLYTGDHPDVAQGLSILARARQALGKTAEARQGFDEAVEMLRRLSPEGSPTLARVLWKSGSARLDNKGVGDAAAALPELEEAVAMAEKLLPREHPRLREYRETLGRCKAALVK